MCIKKFRVFIFVVLSACFVLAFAGNAFSANNKSNILGGRKPKSESDIAILEIEKIVLSFIQEKQDITDSNVQNAIVQQVESSFPLDKDSELEKLNLAEIEKKVDLEADKKYPCTREELKKKSAIEADKIYDIAKINTEVTVEFRQGPYIHKVTGIFRGFTFRNDGIRVGRTIIPLIDLPPKEKVRFDKVFLQQKKEEYIKKCITEYLSKKEESAIKHIKSLVDAITKKNKDTGYVYAWNKWRSPEDVAKIIMKHYARQQRDQPANN